MKKIVCGRDGKIYYARIKKDGRMSLKDRVEVSDDAVCAVVNLLSAYDVFEKEGNAGFDALQPDGSVLRLVLYDKSKCRIAPIDSAEEEENDGI